MFDLSDDVVQPLGYAVDPLARWSSISGEVVSRLGLIVFAQNGESALSADTGIQARAVRVQPASAFLSADVTVTATAVRAHTAEASFDFSSAITANGARGFPASAECASTLGLSATGARGHIASADLAQVSVDFTATPGTVYRLVMPTAKRSITDDWLLKRYPIDAGLSLIVTGGVVREVEVPSQTELFEADYYFLGGRNNPITPDQRATLIAAGFGSYIEEH